MVEGQFMVLYIYSLNVVFACVCFPSSGARKLFFVKPRSNHFRLVDHAALVATTQIYGYSMQAATDKM